MHIHLILLLNLLILNTQALAMNDDVLEVVEVRDINENLKKTGQLKDTIFKTEVIDAEKIQKKNAQNLIQAIEQEPGLQVLNGCSICGIKRVQINGLRGEYTTVLVDEVPLHSTVSSYYGFESLGTLGIASIEVSRGPGASLSAPEAIGGVINVVTLKAKENKTIIDVSSGNNDYKNLTLVSTSVGDEGRRRTTIAGQYSNQGQWDKDNNNINEIPERDTRSLMVKYSQDLNNKLNMDIRINALKAHIFGGPMNKGTFQTINQPTPGIDFNSFINGDVRKKFIGAPGSTAEIIDVDRNEGTLKLTHATNETINFGSTLSYALGKQDSWYEGADYKNINEAFFYDLKTNINTNQNNLLTIGLEYKKEALRSKSHTFFELQGRDSDSFDYHAPGVYLQNIWVPNEKVEFSSAIRFNQIVTNFTDKEIKENEIDDLIIAPRFHVLWKHTPALESRFAYGKGYRSPLTFFESEHGLLDNGFDVDIDHLETSDSITYSLNRVGEKSTTTLSGAWTKVQDIAYVDNSGTMPVLRNLNDKTVEIANIDASFGYQLRPELRLGIVAEKYFYQNRYKEQLITAAVEERVGLLLDWDKGAWDVYSALTWTGTRDLHDYGYGDHYNSFDGTNPGSKKRRYSPQFFTVDVNASYELTRQTNLSFGAKNLLDYTQSESPLYFNSNGDFDVAHTWGPLQGRQFYMGLKSVF